MPFLLYGLVALVGAGAGWAGKDLASPETTNNYQGPVQQDQRAGISPIIVGAVVIGALAAGYFIAKQASK